MIITVYTWLWFSEGLLVSKPCCRFSVSEIDSLHRVKLILVVVSLRCESPQSYSFCADHSSRQLRPISAEAAFPGCRLGRQPCPMTVGSALTRICHSDSALAVSAHAIAADLRTRSGASATRHFRSATVNLPKPIGSRSLERLSWSIPPGVGRDWGSAYVRRAQRASWSACLVV